MRRPPGRAAGRCGQDPAAGGRGRVQPGKGNHPLLEQVPAGLLRQLRHQLRQLRPGGAVFRQRRPAAHRRACATRTSTSSPRCGRRSGTSASTCSTRWSAASAKPPEVAAGAVHRLRLRRVHLDFPQRSRHSRAGADSAGHVRLCRRRGGHESLCVRMRGTARSGAAPSRPPRKLLAEAGYPNGRHAETGEPLVLYFDTTASGPDAKSRLDWMKQAVRQAGRAAGGARHRLQPLPGQDAQGQRAAVRMGLERRLSRSGELLLPAVRTEQERSAAAARMRPTTTIRNSTACSSR